jgi:hypothetical protein
MSSCYVISYDLSEPEQNYEDLIEAIKDYGTWWGHLESTYIVKDSGPSSDIRDNLIQYIDSDDSLLVAKLSGGWAESGIDESGTDWLYDHM